MQQHGLAIRKFQRVVMMQGIVLVDLPEDRGLVVDNVCSPGPFMYAPNLVCEGKLGPRKYANRNVPIFRSAEAACARVKLVGG
jgi:hypothetical protein